MLRMDIPISINPGVQWKLVEGRAVLLDIDRALVLQLDSVGTKIWLLIDGTRTGNDISEHLVEYFDVERKMAEKDVSVFLKQLLRNNAIAVH